MDFCCEQIKLGKGPAGTVALAIGNVETLTAISSNYFGIACLECRKFLCWKLNNSAEDIFTRKPDFKVNIPGQMKVIGIFLSNKYLYMTVRVKDKENMYQDRSVIYTRKTWNFLSDATIYHVYDNDVRIEYPMIEVDNEQEIAEHANDRFESLRIMYGTDVVINTINIPADTPYPILRCEGNSYNSYILPVREYDEDFKYEKFIGKYVLYTKYHQKLDELEMWMGAATFTKTGQLIMENVEYVDLDEKTGYTESRYEIYDTLNGKFMHSTTLIVAECEIEAISEAGVAIEYYTVPADSSYYPTTRKFLWLRDLNISGI